MRRALQRITKRGILRITLRESYRKKNYINITKINNMIIIWFRSCFNSPISVLGYLTQHPELHMRSTPPVGEKKYQTQPKPTETVNKIRCKYRQATLYHCPSPPSPFSRTINLSLLHITSFPELSNHDLIPFNFIPQFTHIHPLSIQHLT